ncbi:MAG: hypothetical protein B7Z10_06960 [Rhodobacterales bacterium 32-66-7]|nr:MAG: hypothetical protein B7Z31_02175 [Rhodobacterales bacterium 12-65-15]OYX25248.1 MAG: hypothetical protein B7Z10_06960 [Rhodobacterales bacterium 32-66-7]
MTALQRPQPGKGPLSGQLSVRGPVAFGLVALVALILGLGVWSTRTSLASAIVVQGKLALPDARQVLQHPDGGVVAEILVRDGTTVAAGDVVLRLDGTALRSELRILDDRLADLAARSARLLAERDGADTPGFPPDLLKQAEDRPDIAALVAGQQDLFLARRATLDDTLAQIARRIDQTRAEGEGVAAQQAALDLQLALIGEELAAQETLLDRGLVAQTTVLALRREGARLAGQIGELTAAGARLMDQIAESEMQASAIQAQRRETALAELREVGPLALELAETRRALLGRIDRLDLRAPVSGVVLDLRIATLRAVLRPAEPVLTIVPQDRPLVVAARLAPHLVDAVSPGQSADLVFPARGGSERPRLTGRVERISADALTDPATGVAYFLVEVMPDPRAGPGDGALALQPGLPVEVYLQTGSQTPLAYLVRPFTDYFSRAFREG